MQPYDRECIVIGYVLAYGKEPAQLAVNLTADKFVFNAGGQFGTDHKNIWEAIRCVYLIQRRSPTLTNVAAELKGEYQDELYLLADRLTDQYRIHEFDGDDFLNHAREVDKQGVVYHMAQLGGSLYTYAHNTEAFAKAVQDIEDIDGFAAAQLGKFRKLLTITSNTTYRHIAEVTDNLIELWQRRLAGEEFDVLPTGIPCLDGLIIAGEMSVWHGLPGSGKTTLALQALFGVALSMVLHDIPGCVCVNSLEMTAEKLTERLAAIMARVDLTGFRKGTITAEEVAALEYWAGIIEQLPIFVDDTPFISTTALQYRASGLHASEHGPVRMIVTDYGELFREEGDSKEQRVDSTFRNQLNLTRMIGCSIIAISQSTQSGDKTYIAGPDGTRYSRGPLHSADTVMELWNPYAIEQSGRLLIVPEGMSAGHPFLLVQKNRYGTMGKIPIGWVPETTTFFDMGLSQKPGAEIVYTHLEETLAKLQQQGEAAW